MRTGRTPRNVTWFVHLAPTKTNGLTKESGADAFQVKSLSMRRFKVRRGVVSGKILDEVAAAVALWVWVIIRSGAVAAHPYR